MADIMIAVDSFLVRNIIKNLLGSSPHLRVIGEAANGAQALERAAQWLPDIIILDIEMPVMNGLECLRQLQRACTAKVIVLTSIVSPGSSLAREALSLGAVEVVSTPTGSISLEQRAQRRLEIVAAVLRAADAPSRHTKGPSSAVEMRQACGLG